MVKAPISPYSRKWDWDQFRSYVVFCLFLWWAVVLVWFGLFGWLVCFALLCFGKCTNI